MKEGERVGRREATPILDATRSLPHYSSKPGPTPLRDVVHHHECQ